MAGIVGVAVALALGDFLGVQVSLAEPLNIAFGSQGEKPSHIDHVMSGVKSSDIPLPAGAR